MNSSPLNLKRLEVYQDITEGSIASDAPWGEDAYKIVKKFLSTREPHEQLEKIATIAKDLKMALEKHFSISDILLEVRDMRLGKAYEGDVFWGMDFLKYDIAIAQPVNKPDRKQPRS